MTKKCWPALVLTTALLVLVGGCSGTSEPTAEPTETPIPTTPPTNTPVPQEPVTVTAHRFVDVGDSIDVSGLGEILEVSPFAGVTLVHDSEAETVTCNAGGTGFVRARYRAEGVDKNQVQTMAVVCIDETGDCDGQTTVTANFEQFLEDGPGGEANYLASGSGALYAVCVVEGNYRLQMRQRCRR